MHLTYFWQHKGYIHVLLDGNSKNCRMNEIRYRSLAKERPSPTFGPISCIRSKFTRMSAHHGANFGWSLKSTASSAMRISCKKLRVVLHHNYYKASLHRRTLRDVTNAVSTASCTMLTVTSCRSDCVPSGLDFETAGDSVVRYFVSNYFLRGIRALRT